MAAPLSLGKYEIRRQLGVGAMGTVYEGWDPFIERRVAIKTVELPSEADTAMVEATARFRREAQAAGRLTHPNIVGVFDYGEADGLAYIVMEFVDGPSLKAMLDQNATLPRSTILRIMEDVLAGLQFSHECGIIHRDIKPANIMLTQKGQAKVADFGIARIENSEMTQAGTMLGTPSYMSPEQFMGLPVDARSDLYSAGVLLYQFLTGRRPFEGSMTAIMHNALHTEPVPPSRIAETVPAAFDAVVRRAMAKRPEDRFNSAAAFMAALRAAVALADQAITDATVLAPRRTVAAAAAPPIAPVLTPAAVPSHGRQSRGRLGAAVIGIAALAVLGGAVFVLLPRTGALPAKPTVVEAAPITAPAIQQPPLLPPPAPGAGAVAQPLAPESVSVPVIASPPALPPPSPRDRAMALARALPCGVLRVAEGARVSGYAVPGAALEQVLSTLREAEAVVDEVTRVDASACAVLAVVAPFVRSNWDSVSPGLVVRPAQTGVTSGTRVNLDVSARAGRLYIDVFQNDGTVRHIINPTQKAGSSVSSPELVAGPAVGPSWVVSISSELSLAAGNRPEIEKSLEYLPVLKASLEAAAPSPLVDIALLSVRPAEPPPAVKTRPPPVGPVKTPLQQPQTLRSGRCSNILARAELGEVLSNEELVALRTECRS